jgi:hypothetical protein
MKTLAGHKRRELAGHSLARQKNEEVRFKLAAGRQSMLAEPGRSGALARTGENEWNS